MIHTSNYNTTVGKIYDVQKLSNVLKKDIIIEIHNTDAVLHNVFNEVENIESLFIMNSKDVNIKRISLLIFPLMVNYEKKNYLITDLRPHIKGVVDVNNIFKSSYNKNNILSVIQRSLLCLCWEARSMPNFTNTFSFASKVYTTWLSNIIMKSYSLEPSHYTNVILLTNLFYQNLFYEKGYDVYSDINITNMAVVAIKDTNLPAKVVYEHIELYKENKVKLDNLEDYIKALTTQIDDVRLKKFNLPSLLTLIKGSWYGYSSKELISSALEHPPTWVSLIYASLTDKSYKYSGLYKVVEQAKRTSDTDQFIKGNQLLLENSKVNEDEYF